MFCKIIWIGYLSYLSTPDYQYWLAGFTPELDPNLKTQTHSNAQTNPGSPYGEINKKY